MKVLWGYSLWLCNIIIARFVVIVYTFNRIIRDNYYWVYWFIRYTNLINLLHISFYGLALLKLSSMYSASEQLLEIRRSIIAILLLLIFHPINSPWLKHSWEEKYLLLSSIPLLHPIYTNTNPFCIAQLIITLPSTNSASGGVTNTWKCHHITTILQKLLESP